MRRRAVHGFTVAGRVVTVVTAVAIAVVAVIVVIVVLAAGASRGDAPGASAPQVATPTRRGASAGEPAAERAGGPVGAVRRTSSTAPSPPTTGRPGAAPSRAAPPASPSTTTGGTPVGGCLASDDDLAKALLSYAKAIQPNEPAGVVDIRHASGDSTWARARVVPLGGSQAGFVAIARCVGVQWALVDAGTESVGCAAPVPPPVRAEIGLAC